MVADRRDPRQEQIKRERAETFWELMDKFIEEYASKSLKRWDQPLYLLTTFVPESFKELRANAITTQDVGDVVRSLSDRPTLARQVLAAISSVFGWGMDFGLVAANPCRQIRRKRFKTKPPRERKLDAYEIGLFWQAFARHGDAGRALKLLLLTGQRPGEVAALRLEDVEGQWWTLPGEPELPRWPGTKNGRTHKIWIPSPAMSLLPSTPTVDRIKLKRAMWKAMRQISAELKVRAATSHDLRRTHGSAVTFLLGFGGSAAMDRIQNHVKGGVTATYDRHDYQEETIDVMERVAAHLLRLAGEHEPDNVVSLEETRIRGGDFWPIGQKS
jgi:integrase